MNEEEFLIEARRRGYELVAADRIKIVTASVEIFVDAHIAKEVWEDYLTDTLSRDIAAKLVEFKKVEIGPVSPETRLRMARAQFAVIVPRTPREPI